MAAAKGFLKARCAGQLLREIVEVLPGIVAGSVHVDGEDVAELSCSIEPGSDPTAELGDRLQKAAIAVHELKIVLPTSSE